MSTRARICAVAAILLASATWLFAQGSQSPSSAPAQQPAGPNVAPEQPAVNPPPKSEPVRPSATQPKPGSTSDTQSSNKPISCETAEKRATAGGASISTQVGDSDQPKQWQPRGGDVSFTIVSFTRLEPNAQVLVCFRWSEISDQTKLADQPKPSDQNAAGDQTRPADQTKPAEQTNPVGQKRVFQNEPIERRPKSIVLSSDGRTLKVGTTIPRALKSPPPWNVGVYSMYLIPITDVRILVLNADSTQVLADVTTNMGVSQLWMAWFLVFIAVTLAYLVLDRLSRKRLATANIPGIMKVHPLLRILSTPNGYASLSQLQIMLWTFVVGASAVYVMALSGELIEITTGTLILLGITGATTIGSQVVGKSTGATTTPPPTDSTASTTVTSPLRPTPDHDRPMWSDLIMNERSDAREVDVTRVQMLYFTFITAGFVLMKAFTNYVIPEIPDGFLTLMGISNAVYMGAKVARKPDDKDDKSKT